jgi:hypothetical protein
MSSKFRIFIAVALIVLMLELGAALFAIYLIGPSVNPIVDFNTTVFLLVLNVSSFTFLFFQLWNLKLRAKIVRSIFFIWIMVISIMALGTYIKDLIQPLFTRPLNDVLTVIFIGTIHPFVWLSLILPTIGVFFGEHALYLLFKRRKQRHANQTNFAISA